MVKGARNHSTASAGAHAREPDSNKGGDYHLDDALLAILSLSPPAAPPSLSEPAPYAETWLAGTVNGSNTIVAYALPHAYLVGARARAFEAR